MPIANSDWMNVGGASPPLYRNFWETDVHIFRKIAIGAICTSAALGLTACGTTSKSLRGYTPTVSLAGLTLNEGAKPALVYERTSASGFGAYNTFIIDPVKIGYDSSSGKKLDPAQLEKMRKSLRAKLVSELVAAGYKIGAKPASDSMRISMTISNLKAPSSALNAVRFIVPVSLSVGQVTVEAVFRESVSNRIDAVAINRAEGNRLFNKKPWSTWGDIEASFQEWANGIRKAVDTAHGK